METLSLASLFPQELDSYQWREDDVSDDESEWECNDDTIVCDDDDIPMERFLMLMRHQRI